MKNSDFISKLLNCNLPSDYSNFVDNNGYGEIDNIEIFGYSPKTKDINKFPCIIGVTNRYRSEGSIKNNEIIIASDDKYIYGYNCDINKYFKKDYNKDYIYIESPFKNGFYQ